MVVDETIKHKGIKTMNENTKEQGTESRPEDAQASEQVKVVSGCDGEWKLLSRRFIEIGTGKYIIRHEMQLGTPIKYPILIEYAINNQKINSYVCHYLIGIEDGIYKEISKVMDSQVKIELIFNNDKIRCAELIYFRHCR